MSTVPGVPDVPGGGLAGALSEQLLGIDHVGIAVPDLGAAIQRYTMTFGFTVELREDNPEQGVSEAMLVAGSVAGSVAGPVANFVTRSVTGSSRLQLVAPLGPDSPIAAFLDRSGPGLQHLALTVADIEEAATILRTRGLRLLYDRARRGTAGSSINFVHPRDTGGVLVELVQRAG